MGYTTRRVFIGIYQTKDLLHQLLLDFFAIMAITTLLIDLDDTVYPPSSGIWGLIGERIDLFIHTRLQLPWDEIPHLRQRFFAEYGTTMRGLMVNYHIDPEDYLKFVHEVPIEALLQPDPDLRKVLAELSQFVDSSLIPMNATPTGFSAHCNSKKSSENHRRPSNFALLQTSARSFFIRNENCW